MTLEIALMIVGFLIVIVGIVSGITSIWLVVKYFRFNRKENSLQLDFNGEIRIFENDQ